MMSTSGKVVVASSKQTTGKGIYTIVTNEEFVVVNGFVASPFALNHFAGNLFYELHRALFAYLPSAMRTSTFAAMNAAADFVAKTVTASKLV